MKILTIRALKIWFFIKIWLLLFVLVGCAPGDRIIFRPDVYISGNFHHYRPFYGIYYPLTTITVVNGTGHELSIIRDGETIRGLISPGQHFKLDIRVDYDENRKISLVALAYKNKRFAGSAERSFYFYGRPYEKRSETWIVRDWDIRDP